MHSIIAKGNRRRGGGPVIESYIVLAGRIRKELDDLERLVSRANRAMNTAQKNPQDTDLYVD